METPKRTMSRDEKSQIQADQMRDLQDAQRAGDIEMRQPNLKSKYLENINPDFKVAEHEYEGYVHIFVRKKHVQLASKEIKNEDRVLKMHAAQFERRNTEGAFTVYDEVEIVHDPRKIKTPVKKVVERIDPTQTKNIGAKEAAEAEQESNKKLSERATGKGKALKVDKKEPGLDPEKNEAGANGPGPDANGSGAADLTGAGNSQSGPQE